MAAVCGISAMFRSHGTDAPREISRFGQEASPFYDAIAKFIRLRYTLLPYIYSLVAAVTRTGAIMMRVLALEFPHDRATHAITDQCLFGPAHHPSFAVATAACTIGYPIATSVATSSGNNLLTVSVGGSAALF